jgi:hypothetical protein
MRSITSWVWSIAILLLIHSVLCANITTSPPAATGSAGIASTTTTLSPTTSSPKDSTNPAASTTTTKPITTIKPTTAPTTTLPSTTTVGPTTTVKITTTAVPTTVAPTTSSHTCKPEDFGSTFGECDPQTNTMLIVYYKKKDCTGDTPASTKRIPCDIQCNNGQVLTPPNTNCTNCPSGYYSFSEGMSIVNWNAEIRNPNLKTYCVGDKCRTLAG